MSGPLYIAVDLGAGSGRVFLAGLDDEEFSLGEIHRFYYPPRIQNGHLRWDFESIFENIKLGIEKAISVAAARSRNVASVGVDSWAVDYGLLDSDGRLIDDPVCYRDERTLGAMDEVFAILDRSDIFSRTGIQFLNFNTLFQLYSERESLAKADRMLMLPDLINFRLTGVAVGEYTNATTTQMVNASSGDWDQTIIDTLKIPRNILPSITAPGTVLGRYQLGDDNDLKVVAVATHDTASAVAAAPLSRGSAFISSGTWSLVGVELDAPLINEETAAENFTNEGGVYGTIRFLKNVAGLWLLESCRKEFAEAGIETSYDELIDAAFESDHDGLIFPDDPRFTSPPSMIDAIATQMTETGQEPTRDPSVLAKIIFDSLAMRYASVLKKTARLTGHCIERVEILGGGGRNSYLNQMTADACGVAVRAGLFEATVVGNALVQAIADGRFESLDEARRYVVEHTDFEVFEPVLDRVTSDRWQQYLEIEKQYS